mmetsp:Transcript_72604/g.228720  ORF Transcript_72604/g.228720 Transcript_72604/m.228720 type:complete len:278 (-) Transcript_72604:598-1431(-)
MQRIVVVPRDAGEPPPTAGEAHGADEPVPRRVGRVQLGEVEPAHHRGRGGVHGRVGRVGALHRHRGRELGRVPHAHVRAVARLPEPRDLARRDELAVGRDCHARDVVVVAEEELLLVAVPVVHHGHPRGVVGDPAVLGEEEVGRRVLLAPVPVHELQREARPGLPLGACHRAAVPVGGRVHALAHGRGAQLIVDLTLEGRVLRLHGALPAAAHHALHRQHPRGALKQGLREHFVWHAPLQVLPELAEEPLHIGRLQPHPQAVPYLPELGLGDHPPWH